MNNGLTNVEDIDIMFGQYCCQSGCYAGLIDSLNIKEYQLFFVFHLGVDSFDRAKICSYPIVLPSKVNVYRFFTIYDVAADVNVENPLRKNSTPSTETSSPTSPASIYSFMVSFTTFTVSPI